MFSTLKNPTKRSYLCDVKLCGKVKAKDSSAKPPSVSLREITQPHLCVADTGFDQVPCYYPIHGYRARQTNNTGKRSIVFDVKAGFKDRPQTLACGRCVGCRLERSRQWAIRCIHEASLYPDNMFITLTYDDENLPLGETLVKTDFPAFMKKYRSKLAREQKKLDPTKQPPKIRYYHCGEYGDENGRPHYHALIFNHTFDDKIKIGESKTGDYQFVSPTLDELWGKGRTEIGSVTFESAAYIARYVMKKVNGDEAHHHYQRVNTETGRFVQIEPEYTTMSRRPGIGTPWLKKYKTDIYPDDFVIVRGKKMKPPRYYDLQLEKENNKQFLKVKRSRLEASAANADNNTPERLVVRETVTKSRLKQKGRKL